MVLRTGMHVLGWVANGILVLDTGSVYYMLACLLAYLLAWWCACLRAWRWLLCVLLACFVAVQSYWL